MSDMSQGELIEALGIQTIIRISLDDTTALSHWLAQVLSPTIVSTPTPDETTDVNDLYCLLTLGKAEFMLKVHPSSNPQHMRIWFCDHLYGRAAPEIVKKTIHAFFYDTFNIEQAPFLDLYETIKQTRLADTFVVNTERFRTASAIRNLTKATHQKSCNKVGLFHTTKSLTPQELNEESKDIEQKTSIKNNS